MGRQAPEGLIGIHTNLFVPALGGTDSFPKQTEEERAAVEAGATFRATGFGYFLEQATRPHRADGHRGLGGSLVLGERTSHSSRGRPGPAARLGPSRLHHVPGESFQAPRTWVQQAYATLNYFDKAQKGGHFAAWEEPALFTTEIRAAFQSLR